MKLSALFLLLLTGPLFAQIGITPPEATLGQQIVAGCDCEVPGSPHVIEYRWSSDEHCTLLTSPQAVDPRVAYIWTSEPGQHTLRCLVTIQAYAEREVIVDAKIVDGELVLTKETIRVYEPVKTQEFTETFTVGGVKPEDPEDPDVPDPPPTTDKVDAVTYVFEQQDGAPPRQVMDALDALNRLGIVATVFERDTTDGTGDIPSQYKAALTAAKAAGLPCLVATSNGKVVRTVQRPTTKEQVLEAAK